MRPSLLDLFGEIPVTLDDVLAWMLAVPGIPPDSPRFARYVLTYDVPAKIRQAKASGDFERAIAPPQAGPARIAAALSAASYRHGIRSATH